MSTVYYVIGEKQYKHNDEEYYPVGGVVPKHIFKDKGKAIAQIEELNLEYLRKDGYDRISWDECEELQEAGFIGKKGKWHSEFLDVDKLGREQPERLKALLKAHKFYQIFEITEEE